MAQITVVKDCQWSSTMPLLGGEGAVAGGPAIAARKRRGSDHIFQRCGGADRRAGSYTVDSPKSGLLDRGKLTARADTEKSRQFTILTPNARFVDLGTEFGVRVDDKGHCRGRRIRGQSERRGQTVKQPMGYSCALRRGRGGGLRGQEVYSVCCSAEQFSFLATTAAAPAVFQRWLDASRELQKRAGFAGLLRFPGRSEQSQRALQPSADRCGAERRNPKRELGRGPLSREERLGVQGGGRRRAREFARQI